MYPTNCVIFQLFFSVNYQHTKVTEIAYNSSQYDVKYTIKTLMLQTFRILCLVKYCQAFKLIKLVIISNNFPT